MLSVILYIVPRLCAIFKMQSHPSLKLVTLAFNPAINIRWIHEIQEALGAKEGD